MKRSFCFPALAIASILSIGGTGPTPALAAPPQLWETEEEIFSPQGRFESCAVTRVFPGDGMLLLTLAADDTFFMLLSRYGLQPPANWQGFITLSVDGGLPYRVPAQTVQHSVVMDLTDVTLLRALLSSGRWLRFEELDDKPYSLEGAAASIQRLIGCVARHQPNKKSPLTNPAKAPEARTPETKTPEPKEAERKEIVADLDAYVNEAAALEDWAMMKRKFADALAGREPSFPTRTRNSDGRTFLVMRFSGFSDLAAAQSFCQGMKARKRDCSARTLSVPPPSER